MSAIACPITLSDAGYPPVQKSLADKLNLSVIAAERDKAPFGRYQNGYPIPAATYKLAMQQRMNEAKALDFRWPFWVGLGLGSVGVALLFLHERSR